MDRDELNFEDVMELVQEKRRRQSDELLKAEASKTAKLLFTLTSIPLSLLHAWVLTMLWTWFVVPIFGLTTISIWQASGLTLFITMFAAKSRDSYTYEYLIKSFSFTLSTCLLTLGFGWLFVSLG